MLKFDITDNFINQNFTFPSFLIRYLMFNINSNGLKKLYKTCKYFYAKLQINIVGELCVADNLTDNDMGPYDIRLCPNQIDQLPNNLWLTEDLLLGDNLNISKFFSKIVRCDPKDIYLVLETRFTMNELKILTCSQTIKYVTIDRTIIYSSPDGNSKAPLEDVLSCFISAHYINIDYCYVTTETMKKLLLLNFHEKIKDFRLYGINELLDANLMDEFLTKNFDGASAALVFKYVDEIDTKIFELQLMKIWS